MWMEQTFVSKLFWWIAKALQNIASATHFTYNEINIIVYYLVIPLTWCIMLDFIIHMPLFTPLWLLFWVIIAIIHRNDFSRWCDKLFVLSQRFILFFGEYVKYSVIICVIIPIIIYGILIWIIVQYIALLMQ